jgi:pimeloyl-ACP methyl ester carboxylesterase
MPIEQQHTVLVIPGFQANRERTRFLSEQTMPWRIHGLSTIVFPVTWEEGTFKGKLKELKEEIDVELDQEKKVSLLGVSAGGTLAVAGMIERPEVHRAVTVSSRLRSITVPNYAQLDAINAVSPSSVQGVEWLEEHDAELNQEMRKRVLNTRACSGDTQVHPSMSFIKGAENVWMPHARSHIRAVSDALTVHSEVIVDFLKKD